MCLSLPACSRARGRRSGFALPSAIFLMLILAALGVFIVRVNVMQTSSTALDILGANAYQAARAGAEWGAYQALRVSGPAPAACFGDTTITFAGTSMAPFTTTVKCVRTSADELGFPVTVDQITATACNQPPCPNAGPTINNYVARQITITVGQP
jgi:MSHA biogenesis protein MshP